MAISFPTPAVNYLPHEAPMVLIDTLISHDGVRTTAELTITDQTEFCTQGQVGSWVGIEYMAQTAGAWMGLQNASTDQPIQVGYLLGTRNYQIDIPHFSVGDHLTVTAECMLFADNGLGSFDCTISRNGAQVAQARLSVFQPDEQLS